MTGSKLHANKHNELQSKDLQSLAERIKSWAAELGFDQLGVCNTDLQQHEVFLDAWIDKGFQGDMDYMFKHGRKRTRPELLVEGTTRVISVRMDYAPENIEQSLDVLKQGRTAYVSRYALGRDYHKVIRARLQKLALRIQDQVGEFGSRVFTDSAPVMEKAIAEKSGLGWIGKHTNVINSKSGSWFFLGEIYTDLPLPVDKPATNHCGSCSQCIVDCPTNAIVGPYQVDARLCISYLTIELKDAIPEKLRPLIGNRVYGCDDCQLVCPWNKFAQTARVNDFSPRKNVTDRELLELFSWSEEKFLKETEGNPIRRIGHERWQRNIATSMGNALRSKTISSDERSQMINSLNKKRSTASELVTEHIDWALAQSEL